MSAQRTQQTIDVSARAFDERVGQLSAARSLAGSVYSRLALIHQVAKAYALEAIEAAGYVPSDLDIDELTDPPLYEGVADADDLVTIWFSYEPIKTTRP